MNITIIGDVMLDIYHMGKIDRISPEAPIPVFDELNKIPKLGGAANLAANIKSILPDHTVNLIMKNISYKNDEMYKMFLDLLVSNNVNLFRLGSYEELVRKHRFIDIRNYHQIGLRLDIDKSIKRNSINIENKSSLYNNLFDIVNNSSIIVFSDYCKGIFDDILIDNLLLSQWVLNIVEDKIQVKTFLDSRNSDLSKFKNVNYFKPNNKEYELFQKFKPFCYLYFQKILHTMSENGMRLLHIDNNQNEKEIKKINSMAKNIVDPTGAGDTAMAGFIYGIVNNMDDVESMYIANALSSISCSKFGTYVVKQEDLIDAFKIIEDYKTKNP